MATKLVFKCPKCESSKIEEVMVDMTVATEISSVVQLDDNRVEYVTGEEINKDGHVDRYQCRNCGYTIVDDNSPHAEEGLDEYALVRAIHAINNPPEIAAKLGDLITHTGLIHQFGQEFAVMEGEELAKIWNDLFPGQVKYNGDSMYEWVSG